MKLEKDFGGMAAQEIDAIEAELKQEMQADEDAFAKGTKSAFSAYARSFEAETSEIDGAEAETVISGSYDTRGDEARTAQAFEKDTDRKTDFEELKVNAKGLARELIEAARDLGVRIRRDVPNKKLRVLMKIGIGAAIFAAVNKWWAKLLIAAAAVYFIFENDEKRKTQ